MSVDLPTLTATSLTVDDGGIAWLTLNRPEAANARNQRMRDELRDIYAYLRQLDEVRVVVLTGAGDRFFCAGMDLKESANAERLIDRRERLRGSRDIELLADLPMPTIAAVNGYALGGGCEMALACDLRVVAAEAQIGLPELTHGLVPGGGGTQRLPRLIGQARTLELLYLGRRLSGAEAADIGLATTCVARAELLPTVTELAGRIAALPPIAVRYAKALVRRSLDTPLSAGLDLELDALLALLDNRA
jgi:enoyl-CoA hydratase